MMPNLDPSVVAGGSATPSTMPVSSASLPAANEFITKRRSLSLQITLFTVLGSLVLAFFFTVLQLDVFLIMVVTPILICIAAPVIAWHWPRMALYTTLAGVCLFEVAQTNFPDAFTDRFPFFWNINTIVNTFTHADFKAVPLNLMEVLLLMSGISCLVKAIYARNFRLHCGPLIGPFLVYLSFVVMGIVHGLALGADYRVVLLEVRCQFYIFIAYLISVNCIREDKHLRTLMWVTIWCVGIKGILYTFRRYVTLAGLPLPDQGVGSHEEAFLFNTVIVLLINLGFCRAEPGMQKTIGWLLPVIILGQLACNRRSGIASLIVLLPMLFMAASVALPTRRRLIFMIATVIAVTFSIYYPIFKDKEGIVAQPARAVKSQFTPDPRDKSSNEYRDAENEAQVLTITSSPIIGWGYGRPFIHTWKIVECALATHYDFYDILPHNQVLWIWQRIGTPGFLSFWMLVASIIVRTCRLLRRTDLVPLESAAVLQVLSLVIMLMVFGLLDLQLSCMRDMLFVGFFIGAICGPMYPHDPEEVPQGEEGNHPSVLVKKKKRAFRRFPFASSP